MALTSERLAAYAVELDQAERTRRPIGPLTEREPDLTADDAYRIQLAWMEIRKARRRAGGGQEDRPHLPGHAEDAGRV